MYENDPLEDDSVRVLEDVGIRAQPTLAARLTFVNFIWRGNSVAGKNPEERIQILRDLQATWDGKRVKSNGTELEGTVMYLIAESFDSVQATKLFTGRQIVLEGAFYAMILWDRRKPTKLRLARLQILEDPPNA